MCAALIHRGPDDEGCYVGQGVGLGMRRLSIIDLAGGHQPLCNEDGSVWVVFNGEIYNFRELRHELEGRGHRFTTETDTETIVHLYEEYGPHCVTRLRGMFAFALWDARRQQVVLARDRLGIKPLYYAEASGRLVFASELKAILQLPGIERRLNWYAVQHLFTWLTTPAADSILEGIRKLEPGHILIARYGGAPLLERYWDVRSEPDYGHSEGYFVERLRELLHEAVRLHLVSDVPLGAFLSGGIDSSSVVAMMARAGSRPVKTFSIGFADQDYSELHYARLIANAFGTDHHELVLEPDVIEDLDELTWFLDEPFGDSSAIPTYMVSKLAAQHVTVVLSGDGGDELFAGYDRYLVEERERRLRFIPDPLRGALRTMTTLLPPGLRGRNFLQHILLPYPERYLDAIALFGEAKQRALFRPDVLELVAGHDPWAATARRLSDGDGHWLSALQDLDLHTYLPLDILTKVDRMSMAHSIEARPPLLDHKLVEFAATIPPELKLHEGVTKGIFKRAVRGILPDQVIDRPKRGFAIPLGRWFKGQLHQFVRELLLSETSRNRGIFNPNHIEDLTRRRGRGRTTDLDLELWTLISFELWCRTFLDGSRRIGPVPRADVGMGANAGRALGSTGAVPAPLKASAGWSQ
ncbi:MAG: asparagine synthase (glutamine-hydrolyzing) [Armatimonadetes bacterium 13_1_40CM_64_14]|nr:MAG: asparagine synthase (glutamine-hydrolyzing) [Armatimonadetes bacterium 13_1_40CM_64_14]